MKKKVVVLRGGEKVSVLKLGFMSNGELAEWFNVKENTIAKKKTDYMKKLEDYCVFEKCRGGICVKEIIG